MNARTPARGNALFLILIAVALFAALSYAVTQSGRGTGNADREKAMLAAAVAQQCTAYVERAATMLEIVHGCPPAQISYELEDGTNDNPLAPADEHCHVFRANGAGATPCGIYTAAIGCDLTALAVGEKCDDADIVYAGMVGGNRIYAALTDHGAEKYSTAPASTGATSMTDGLANTNTLVADTGPGSPHPAALACRGLGPDWYLPARDELDLLYDVRNTGAFSGTFDPTFSTAAWYLSSSENAADEVWFQRFYSGEQLWAGDKTAPLTVRCVRRD